MISEIRSYFKGVIREVDSDLKQHDEYFTAANIPDTTKEDTFFLQFGELTTSRINSNMVGTVQVNVYFWKNGYNDTVERLDEAFCNAIEIQAKLMDQTRVSQTEFIKSVEGAFIIPSPVADNDNLAEFNLQFTVTTGYKAF